MNILDQIIANKKIEVACQKEIVPIGKLMERIERKPVSRKSFRQALLASDTGIIAEFKRKSPSKGWISEHADAATVTAGYQQYGASAVSVLTDGTFFGGSLKDMEAARSTLNIPILRKDFIIDEYQLYQAKAMHADVILLIAAALTIQKSMYLSALAQQLNLEVLLEIHQEQELAYIQPNINVVGINNRDLTTFVTDIQRSLDLGSSIPDNFPKISESGISRPETVRELREAGFCGFLMGENFMKTDNPGKALEKFIKEVKGN